MSRDKAHLRDVVDSFELAIRYLGKQTRDQLGANQENLDAVMRRIEIIGEATKRLSSVFRNANPQVPWRDMAAMRDRVIHGYDRVDVERVFDAVAVRMPAMLPELRRLLDSLPEPV